MCIYVSLSLSIYIYIYTYIYTYIYIYIHIHINVYLMHTQTHTHTHTHAHTSALTGEQPPPASMATQGTVSQAPSDSLWHSYDPKPLPQRRRPTGGTLLRGPKPRGREPKGGRLKDRARRARWPRMTRGDSRSNLRSIVLPECLVRRRMSTSISGNSSLE